MALFERSKDKPVHEIITERFLEQLKKGIIPWKKPWISVQGERVGAWGHSLQSKGKPYSLLNQMMLPLEGEYITMNQIKKEGGKLKKGSKGYQIFYWDSFKTTQKEAETNREKEVTVPFLKYYTVFHISDCEGITQNFEKSDIEKQLAGLTEPQKCKKADEIVKKYLEESGVILKHVADINDRTGAYYSPQNDQVVLPLKKQFNGNKAEYYSTLFHELIHSTGHRDRLNRLFTSARAGRGKEYALEELVAEIGACGALYNLGIETNDSVMNSSAYLKGWFSALSNDTRMIVKAASRADRALRYIFNGPEGIYPHNDVKEFKEDEVKK